MLHRVTVRSAAGVRRLQSVYWATTTLSTVGYGDVTPVTTEEQIFTVRIIHGSKFSTSVERTRPTSSADPFRRSRTQSARVCPAEMATRPQVIIQLLGTCTFAYTAGTLSSVIMESKLDPKVQECGGGNRCRSTVYTRVQLSRSTGVGIKK